ncbi:MAG: PIN domain-containing protein [Elusimicrobia bacterium]|nr:PIN domain-containing protein [Elusimicrobiota bacterium]
MKLRVYFDTSVFCAYYDERVTDRQMETEELWKRLQDFDAATSELAREELEQTADPDRRAGFQMLLKGFDIHPLTREMKELAADYISAGVFTPAIFNDALHVAAAVMTRQDILLSWNFKHLVNRRRRAEINDLNAAMGLPAIEIMAPPEI